MRHLRTLVPLAKTGWYPKGESCGAIQNCSSHKHHVLLERVNLIHSSKMRWLLKSYCASAPSDTVECRKSRLRVSKNERKALVETFVRKYREMNSGKFPTPSDAQKELGGSYYFVREIVQKLQHKSNMSSMDNTEPENTDVFHGGLPGENVSSIPKADSGKSRSKGYHLKQDKSKSIGTQAAVNLASKKKPTLKAVAESKLASQELPVKEESNASELSESFRELHQKHHEVAETQSKYSVWQSLKSFANEILGKWKG